jgi:hypothetical protein
MSYFDEMTEGGDGKYKSFSFMAGLLGMKNADGDYEFKSWLSIKPASLKIKAKKGDSVSVELS